ncbi:uncharacterized protein LOC129765027 isoform X2 [Toxorhynchites rutilus septentrionalis]|uniref:uncharacterized protein LOC129765027 isoform X2 n=1 Tax=Toxorhynchites rutilus septentrionalis TaxID=329112 RepID=UPI00247A322A|nr:uncharacterized protein LOC129765027 isoform X2 [Toxorhynchites rutilus septentrionalis]
MNRSAVRKCEEYLLNIPGQRPPQKRAPSCVGHRPPAVPTSTTTSSSSRNPSSSKPSPQAPCTNRRKQSINNSGAAMVAVVPGAAGKGKKLLVASAAACAPITGREKQANSATTKLPRPSCRQQRASGGNGSLNAKLPPPPSECPVPPNSSSSAEKASDNVNQNDNIKPAGSDRDYGRLDRDAGSGGQTGQPALERIGKTETWDRILSASPSLLKAMPQHERSENPSSISGSSVAIVPPQPSVVSLPKAGTYCGPPPSDGEIYLCHFDPLRTLQLLTLELKSKLKEHCPEHIQLYRIAKELLCAVKILTERSVQQSASIKCANCEHMRRETQNVTNHNPPVEKQSPVISDDRLSHLEDEIKRLQTLISDKQTAEGGLIEDLNRKLRDTAARCRHLKHARDEAEKKLLYASVENERLNFLLRAQSSTMSNLQSDFKQIGSLADCQIELLEGTDRNQPKGVKVSPTLPEEEIDSIIGNHHRNYRHPSGGGGGAGGDYCTNQHPSDTSTISSSSSFASVREKLASTVEKVSKQGRHYAIKNNAEKESDAGNDVNDSEPPKEPAIPYPLSAGLIPGDDGDDGKNSSNGNRSRSGSSDNTSGCEGSGGLQQWPKHYRWQRKDAAAHWDGTERVGANLKTSSGSSSSRLEQLLTRGNPTKRASLIDSSCVPIPAGVPNEDIIISNQGIPFAKPEAPKVISCAATNGYGGSGTSGITDDDSKTNDCASSARRQQQLQKPSPPPPPPQLGLLMGASECCSEREGENSVTGKGKMDAASLGEEKYPGDYGDKFERRESCSLREKKLCRNRSIIGPIDGGIRPGAVDGAEGLKERRTISAANEPASARTEEFSIDFDDITLPSSPMPYTGVSLSTIGCGLNSDDE